MAMSALKPDGSVDVGLAAKAMKEVFGDKLILCFVFRGERMEGGIAHCDVVANPRTHDDFMFLRNVLNRLQLQGEKPHDD